MKTEQCERSLSFYQCKVCIKSQNKKLASAKNKNIFNNLPLVLKDIKRIYIVYCIILRTESISCKAHGEHFVRTRPRGYE